MPVISLGNKVPRIGRGVFIASTAYVIGDVTIGDNVSIWPFAVIRGDEDSVFIDRDSNVQDGVVIHTDVGFPVRIGRGVTIGHRAIVHGATIEDEVIIGMGAIVLNGAVIGSGSIIGAGAVVTPGTRIPPNSVAVGVPARVIRQATDEDIKYIRDNYMAYLRLARLYMDNNVNL
ncbi:MAG: gamma carbonic anhydrase family protein [Vulcanisaeta sp.]|nr:gamma carbonic anhydrase family protein [Vulcanisaeta sp.]MCG2870095.1 gamma carbonic anhydrase family protein [Vulcanisaeta sp.]MCG2880477.1 gamma carbonic anhydrase family protein [Vulcanisaeta sp.]MCG2887144.1 gamma carbonic anhydrase family protein [Vulcanisaeta sp.]MCG2892711.1 gamma carbonic anhydrase family protein [Vulcanisaeta sp.]